MTTMTTTLTTDLPTQHYLLGSLQRSNEVGPGDQEGMAEGARHAGLPEEDPSPGGRIALVLLEPQRRRVMKNNGTHPDAPAIQVDEAEPKPEKKRRQADR